MNYLKDLGLIYESVGYNILYHISPSVNTSSILKNGLTPSIGDRSTNLGEVDEKIYMFGSMDDVEYAIMNWLGDEFDEDEALSLFEIKLPLDWPLEHEAFEYTTSKPIPPTLIKLLDDNYGY